MKIQLQIKEIFNTSKSYNFFDKIIISIKDIFIIYL